MTRTLKINPNAVIGTVIYIVEGQSTEFNLLKSIYGRILQYDYIEQRRGQPDKFIDNRCPHNRVFVINSSESNISDISDTYLLRFKLGKELKSFMGKEQNAKIIQFNKITPETLKFAANELFKYLDAIDRECDLNDLLTLNLSVFDAEEMLYKKEKYYAAVSQLILSLLYLGIIEIE